MLRALLLSAVLPGVAQAAPCARPAGPAVVVRCALASSPEVRLARGELRVLGGRRVAAGTWLPSHPVLSFIAAERRLFSGAGAPVLNWYVVLSQQLEIGGQRGLRLDVADAEAAAQVRRVAAAEREAAAAALAAYYEQLAAREERQLADEVGRVAESLADLGAARAREALLSPVDADVARAEAVRVVLARPEAARRHEAARALLGTLLGAGGPADAEGALDAAAEGGAAASPGAAGASPGAEAASPGAAASAGASPGLVERALTLRGDVAAAEMERRAALARVRLERRERLPALTLSFQAQSDGFDERVLGAGLSLPLPLPSPVGPSRRGEIIAAEARAAQAETSAQAVQRRVRLEVERAVAGERAFAEALRLIPAELVARARTDLRALGAGLSARQLSVREALLMQRSLIELLQAHVRARLGLALARVELARAAGLPLAGGAP